MRSPSASTRRPAVLVGLLLLGACTQPLPPAASCDIAIVGTSLTAGYGLRDPDQQSWGAGVRRKMGPARRVDLLGISGSTAESWIPTLGPRLRDLPAAPGWVIVELGANEMLQGTPAGAFAADFRSVLDTIHATFPAARIALARVTPGAARLLGSRGREAMAVADSIAAIGTAAGWPVIPDLLEGVRFVARFNQDDGTHPNPAGAQIAFANAWRALGPWFAGGGCQPY